MKILVIVFVLLLVFSSISSVSAHPSPVKATIVGEDGLILYNVETSGKYGESISNITPPINDENTLQLNDTSSDVNFIWVLTGVIAMIMTPVVLITYKEEIPTVAIKSNNQ